jgi:crotonobetainyl-CoA:carnitine CoA-transferase CaiB-like acyl-CoA transferase
VPCKTTTSVPGFALHSASQTGQKTRRSAPRPAAGPRKPSSTRSWYRSRDLDTSIEELLGRGAPKAPVVSGRSVLANPQVRYRGFGERIDHPVTGRHEIYSLPFRLASSDDPWFSLPAPTLGQHNREVLQDILGVTVDDLATLEKNQVIGTRPLGV